MVCAPLWTKLNFDNKKKKSYNIYIIKNGRRRLCNKLLSKYRFLERGWNV